MTLNLIPWCDARTRGCSEDVRLRSIGHRQVFEGWQGDVEQYAEDMGRVVEAGCRWALSIGRG